MGNVSMEARDINYRGGETKMSVEEALKSASGEAAAIAQLQTDVGNLQTTKANLITIAPVFSAETAYDPGDLVYYNGLTYRCVNAHEGEWDADDFAATTIANELGELKSGLTNAQNNINGKHLYYQNAFNISTSVAYGSLYRTYASQMDISSLGISNVNDIKSINLSTANADRAFGIITDYTATAVTIMFISDTQLTDSATKLFIDIVTN